LAEQTELLRADAIRDLLEEAGAFVVAAVAIEIERSGRGRLSAEGQDPLEGLAPRRALELFLRSKTPPLSEDRIAALLAAADELLLSMRE
jgi:exonuclease SbcD